MIEAILPAGVAVAEAFGDLPDAELFPEEADAIGRAVRSRRQEYATVRHCARVALGALGRPAAAILNGADREPLWPRGVVGSMTHCDGYRAAALADAASLASIGIDAEPDAPLPAGLLRLVARQDELPRLMRLAAVAGGVHWDRLIFSAKESVFKAWFPLAHCWLDFAEASVEFEPAGQRFTAVLHRDGPVLDGRPVTAVHGRWVIHSGLIATAVVIAR